MKNKINLTKFVSLILLITVTAIILVSGTYAKYTSTASGTDATIIAKWSFKVNNTEIAVTGDKPTVAFDLFKTINDTKDDNKETDVKEGLIAPGTQGSFEFVLKNTSEVTAKYNIELSVDNANIPLEFSIDDETWVNNLEELELSDVIAINGEKNVTVKWRWAFEGDTDSLLGGQQVTVSANITATQVDYMFLEKLEQKYELIYYSSLSDAIADVNNGSFEESSIDNKETAEACIYTDSGVTNVVLLKDITLSTAIKPTTDMTINLGGNTISCSDTAAFDIMSGNITIDGRIKGSAINTVTTGDKMARAFQARAGNVTVMGGTYTAYSETANSCGIMTAANLTISDATILADGVSGSNKGLQINAGSTVEISNSNITANTVLGNGNGILNNGTLIISDSTVLAKTVDGKNSGLSNNGTATVSNCDIRAYSNYTAVNGEYTASSKGISSTGSLTVIDSYVYGTHSGLQNYGDLYVDGGTYEGYGHGGFYLANADYTSYIKNATIRESGMPDGYTSNITGNDAGAYIGSYSNITVYMDNCDFYGNRWSIVLRGSSGEQNNVIYISNSRINEGGMIRTDTQANKLYNGIGNNFTSSDITLSDVVIDTDIDYSTLFPEY